MEGVTPSVSSVPVHLGIGHISVEDVLPVGVPEWPHFGGVLRFLKMGILVGVLGVGVVGRLELPLPTQVVRVAGPELDFVVSDHPVECSCGTCG